MIQHKKAVKRVLAGACAAAMCAASSLTPLAAVTLFGDANNDSSFNITDISLAQHTLLNSGTVNAQGFENTDMNSDGVFNVVDLLIMRRTPYSSISSGDTDNVVTSIVYGQSSVTLYNVNGSVVSASNATNVNVANNTYVTIHTPGEFDVSGQCTEGQLVVNCDKTTYASGLVTLNLVGLTLSNSTTSPVYIAAIDDEVEISSKNGYVNTISDGTSYTNDDGDSGAIYACDDIKFKGKGTLNVNGNCGDGIVCKNDIKIWNSTLNVTAVDDGIRGKDSVRIGDPDDTDYSYLNVNVTTTGGDGIKSTDESDTTCGFVRVSGGNVTVNSYGDCISGVYNVEINGGNLDLVSATAYGTTSSKGLKAGYTDDTTSTTYTGNVSVNGGYVNVNTTDDCINANGDVNILGGQLELTINAASFTGDGDGRQAIHADNSCYLGTSGGAYTDFELVIYNAYEGIEAYNIYQRSGATVVTSFDDAYNVAGGADNSGSTGMWPGQGGGMGSSSSAGVLEISGGFSIISVSDGDHDGYDSNGTLTISGGICVSNGQEPFDCDGGVTYTGGVYVKNTGSSSMGGGMGGMGGMGGSTMTESVSVSASVSANTRITLCDGSGNIIVSFIADKTVSSLIAGCTAYSSAAFYTGGTLTNSTYFQTLDDTQLAAYGGILSGGSKLG